ncbi:MAG: hypothetical protein K2X72_06075 [Reyranella sp.]|nr:hypothetical protein [Reyranella sp.]
MVLQDNGRPPLGFVIALRAEVADQAGSARSEWLIASRWGDGGTYLSIARTLVPVRTTVAAPPYLVPRWSALALLDARSAHSNSPIFSFIPERPLQLPLAGRFCPSLGSAQMECRDESIRLHGDLNCMPRRSGRAYRFDGTRVIWVGEFIQSR